MQEPRHLRVFLSSPGDVAAERVIARRILSTLPYDPFLRGRITIEIVAWDGPVGSVPMTASVTPQEAINRGLARPSACDMVIVILWRRLGTPLADTYKRPDGTRYGSGTEWEYEDALLAPKQPLILVYRRTAGTDIDPADPDLAKVQEQRDRVGRFFEAFQDADGSSRGGVNTYATTEEFETQLGFHLREILSRLLVASTTPADVAVQTTRLDAATPRRSVIGRPTQVRVQVCLPSSAGLLRDPANGHGGEPSAEQFEASLMPILFRKAAGSGAPLATPVAVELFAPHHHPAHSTQELLLVPAQDSGVVSFSLEPRQAGVTNMRVALRQRIDGAGPVTSGMVTLESTVVESSGEAGDDDVWRIVSRLLGTARAAASALDPPAFAEPPHARLTLKIVEDTERKTIEKYLTLDIPLLCSILPVTRKAEDLGAFSPSGQQASGTRLFEHLKPALVERLRHDDELFAFLRDHPGISRVDLVLLIEDRIAAVVPDHSPRVVAAIIARVGLHEFVGRHPDMLAPSSA